MRLYHVLQEATTAQVQLAHAVDFATRDGAGPGLMNGEENGEEEGEGRQMAIGLTAWQGTAAAPTAIVATVEAGMCVAVTCLRPCQPGPLQ